MALSMMLLSWVFGSKRMPLHQPGVAVVPVKVILLPGSPSATRLPDFICKYAACWNFTTTPGSMVSVGRGLDERETVILPLAM